MENILTGLRAAAEPTRLRLLALCAQGELTVTELTKILGQSQPRISRHLKLLCESGLLDRFREGTWVFYRISENSENAKVGRALIRLLPAKDPNLLLDLQRLERVKEARAQAAASYFRANAPRWDEIRSLHVPEEEVERVLLDLASTLKIESLLDVGTGTGRMLEVFAPCVSRAVGIDRSHDMLAVARMNLERAGLSHFQVRHGDMYQLPFPSGSFDAVVFHQVLHFADNPSAALLEAARVLRPGGVTVIVDFAPHDMEYLRKEHAHRRLGFSDDEVRQWFKGACLEMKETVRLPGQPLTVSVWSGILPVSLEEEISLHEVPRTSLREVTT